MLIKIPAKIELFIIPTDFTQKANSVISKFIFSIYCEICCIKKIINSKCLIPFKGDPGKILTEELDLIWKPSYFCINNYQGTISMKRKYFKRFVERLVGQSVSYVHGLMVRFCNPKRYIFCETTIIHS